jgi:hypothetical protein
MVLVESRALASVSTAADERRNRGSQRSVVRARPQAVAFRLDNACLIYSDSENYPPSQESLIGLAFTEAPVWSWQTWKAFIPVNLETLLCPRNPHVRSSAGCCS